MELRVALALASALGSVPVLGLALAVAAVASALLFRGSVLLVSGLGMASAFVSALGSALVLGLLVTVSERLTHLP